jgi:hypothetical protein
MSTDKQLRNLTPHGAAPPGAHPPPILACTRFNNKTWQEYQQWMTTHQQSYEQTYHRPLKCIYGCPREISHKKIPPQAEIIVIEMNNDENRIMGIGKIENKTASETYRSKKQSSVATVKFNLFSDRNYTRYIYIGNTHYATREELERNHTQDAQYINEQLINIMPQTPHPPTFILESLERLLFKGSGHMKRGSGISRCSLDTLLHVATKPRSAPSQPRASRLKTKGREQPPQREQEQPPQREQEQPQQEQPQQEQEQAPLQH